MKKINPLGVTKFENLAGKIFLRIVHKNVGNFAENFPDYKFWRENLLGNQDLVSTYHPNQVKFLDDHSHVQKNKVHEEQILIENYQAYNRLVFFPRKFLRNFQCFYRLTVTAREPFGKSNW